jgi:Response regulators consisting of a CheY-like receiver domain and a winged-helix DNA-binding domain
MADITRVVLAEDDSQRASELRTILERAGAYQVWVTRRCAEIMDVMRESGAAWLILDLELEDGLSLDIVPNVKSEFGDKVIIIALTGYYERYNEQMMLKAGVDIPLRKPYEPGALLIQMSKLRDRLDGVVTKPVADSCLKIGDGILNLRTGIYEQGDKTVILTEPQRQLINVLSSSRAANGKWNFVDRGVLMVYIWGDEAAMDPFTAGARLRKLVQRLRELFEHNMVTIKRGTNHSARYALDSAITTSELEKPG